MQAISDRNNAAQVSHPSAVPDVAASICAVIVTYFPDADCADNLAALAPQVGKLLIVDNGSSAATLQPVEAAAQRLGATIIRLGSNLGIATALNVGLRFARDHGYRWLATFDQDSQATPGMIQEMFRALHAYPLPQQIAVIAACPVDRRLGYVVRYPSSEPSATDWRLMPCVGTSGNVVDVKGALAVGGFEDSLFIDYVDFEFCLRLRRHGYCVMEATRAQLLHSVGHMQLRCFNRVPITNHSPLRRYYISRNRVIVWRRYWRHEPRWLALDITSFLFETLFIVLYEQQAATKLSMILRGFRDSIKGIRGAYAPKA